MIMVDTSVAIDHLRGHASATELLDRRFDEVAYTSEIVRFELLTGARTSEEDALETFLSTLRILPVDEVVSRRAALLAKTYRRSHSGIDMADYLIAASALETGAELLTRSVRHFPMLEGITAPY